MKTRISIASLATSIGTVLFIWMLIVAGHSAVRSASAIDDPQAGTGISGTTNSPMAESSWVSNQAAHEPGSRPCDTDRTSAPVREPGDTV